MLYFNEPLLEQIFSIYSSIFENPIAREAFSFEQLLEIVSVNKAKKLLESIINYPNSRELLISIGKDSQNWQAKFQYLMNLEDNERYHMISQFGVDGSDLVQEELERREQLFVSMERGYFEEEEYGRVDCEYSPEYLLPATFGITIDEANELMKKYGADLEKLNIQSDEDKHIFRKLQIIKELSTPLDFDSFEDYEFYYGHYYASHKEELHALSREVSPFFKVDLENSFLDLYARQYDRALGVQVDKIMDTVYDGKSIPAYEVSGDFMLLIRSEQNVSPTSDYNFWDAKSIQVFIKGLCQNTISQDYIRTVNYEQDDICYIGTVSCKDGELRMASTTNIESKTANIALSNVGVKSSYGHGVVLRVPREQINNSRGANNETDTSRSMYNSETGLYERRMPDYIVFIQETNDTDIFQDERFKTAQFAASQTGIPILIIPKEKCAQREEAKLQVLKDKLLGKVECSEGETDESIIKEMIVKFNNNREGTRLSPKLKDKYFTEKEHIEIVNTINARLSQLKETNQEQYERLVQTVRQIYLDEIAKYYAFSYDRTDVSKEELDIDATREHLKPYEDFLIEQEEVLFILSDDEKNAIKSTMRNISQTSYYDMNKSHALSHIQKVIMFSGILAKNEDLSREETQILLAAAAFHDSGRAGAEGDSDHALASARLVREYYEKNPNNPFGINADNISMIQAVIEYHEHREREIGSLDNWKISDLREKYNISYDDNYLLRKLCGLLKDADALDRARFGKRNEKRWSLNANYLNSETAKSISMIRFSEDCNFAFKEIAESGTGNLSESMAEEVFESLLDDFNRLKLQVPSNQHETLKSKLQEVIEMLNTKVRDDQ